MHSSVSAGLVSAAALAVVLAWAVRRPRGWPEAAAAVPAAGLVIAIGAVTRSAALAEARRLAPVVGFLGCVLVLAQLCDDDGLFRYLGTWLSGRGPSAGVRGGSTARSLFARVFLVASAITAVLSLDATVVLLTPVVLIAADRLRVRARPHAYACGHLANSASLLLPVSNLTNLLAFTVSGLSFAGFAALMALPWLAAIGVEYAVIGRFFGGDLAAAPDGGGAGGRDAGERPDVPVFSLVVVALTLGGFVVASAAGANPAWAALGGAALLAVRALARRETTPVTIARSADVPFLLFVLALGVIVTAVVDNGLGSALRPAVVSGTSLPALLAVAGLAAVLAAVVNNLPAVLVLLPIAAPSGAGAVLAVLIGVNIGPNLTYTGSLATLLWRRVLQGYDTDAPLGEFTRLGVATVLPSLALSVVALWLGLQV
ncbi:arsenic transporter [Trebonia kvetii]|uniref:Arsenic transporter n=1 Tax=Trebonia kvetii TaxID=2480626 RepID=A0A6P2BPP7_9ACTN|nr:SLC13 family permease [Trebonia kvetii]TVZ00627.1 arsenic transporter [Trebonia kvetii]